MEVPTLTWRSCPVQHLLPLGRQNTSATFLVQLFDMGLLVQLLNMGFPSSLWCKV